MTLISYIIVLVGGPIVLTVSTLLLQVLAALLLASISIRFRAVVAGFMSGVLGSICVWLFGNLVFTNVDDAVWASLHAIVAVSLAITIPALNDVSHAKKVKTATSGLPTDLHADAYAEVSGRYAQLVGYVVGGGTAFSYSSLLP